jgi:hypothetical protein
MSDLTTEDCIAYQAFLHDPLPAARWINPALPALEPALAPLRRQAFEVECRARTGGVALDV